MSTTPTIGYRLLDSSYEPQFNGPGLTDKDAVAQAIGTRLRLFAGEWWENVNDGLPLFQSILGAHGNTVAAITLIIQQRIFQTPYVLEVTNVESSFNPSSRAFQFSCEVLTAFGSIFVSENFPMPPSQGVLSNGL